MTITKTEPVAVAGSITAVGVAVDGVLNGFEIVHWTQVQNGLVLALFSAVVVAVTAVARSRVTPVAAPTVTVPLATPPAADTVIVAPTA